MEAKLITPQEQYKTLHACVYSVAEAAEKLGVSEATIRKTARKLGVKKIAGRAVAGFISFAHHPLPVSLSYTD